MDKKEKDSIDLTGNNNNDNNNNNNNIKINKNNYIDLEPLETMTTNKEKLKFIESLLKEKEEVFVMNNITIGDLQKLNPKKFLNDVIINNYTDLISDRNKETKSNYYICNTQWFTKLASGGHESVKRWMKQSIFEFDKVIVPIHEIIHWLVIVINFNLMRIELYDSMSHKNKEYMKRIRDYLQQEYESTQPKNYILDLTQWKDQFYGKKNGYALQDNGYDCGVHASQCINFICAKKQPNFKAKHMVAFRQRMKIELLTQKLLKL